MDRFTTLQESCLDGVACSDCADDYCDCRNCAMLKKLNGAVVNTSLTLAKTLVSSKTLLVDALIIKIAKDRSENKPAEEIAVTEQKLTIARQEQQVAMADLIAEQEAAA